MTMKPRTAYRRRPRKDPDPHDLVASGAQVERWILETGKAKARAAGITYGKYLERLILSDETDERGVPLWVYEDENNPQLDLEME